MHCIVTPHRAVTGTRIAPESELLYTLIAKRISAIFIGKVLAAMPDRDREEEESEGFKVVDRRLFTSEGERRPDAEAQPAKPTSAEPRPAPEPQKKPEAGTPPPRKAPAETTQPQPEHKHAGPEHGGP